MMKGKFAHCVHMYNLFIQYLHMCFYLMLNTCVSLFPLLFFLINLSKLQRVPLIILIHTIIIYNNFPSALK